MPLTINNVVHTNDFAMTSGSTSIVVSLAGADSTSAGNTVLVFMSLSGAVTVTPPAGFVQDTSGDSGALLVFRKSEVGEAETSWTFTAASSTFATWYVEENDGIDPVEPLDASANSGGVSSTTDGGTRSTTTTTINAALSSGQFAVFKSLRVTSGSIQSWSAYTNGFAEAADNPGTTGVGAPTIAVARGYFDGSTSTFESTATFASTGGTANTCALMVSYRAADSPVVAPLSGIWGFEWGHHGGLANAGSTSLMGVAALPTTGTYGTNYLIQSASARNSGYGLRIVCSASTGAVTCLGPNTNQSAFAMNVRVVSATTDPAVVARTTLGNSQLYVLYDPSTTQFGVRWGTGGTPVWQTGTTALNTWTYIQWRIKTNSTSWHCDWRIETGAGNDVNETSPADASVAGSGNVLNLELGATVSAQTATMEYDDVIASRYYAAWPLGVHQIHRLVPETTGATVSGTSSNFNEFTANGTLAAFASTSGQRIDEVPPTVSASSDGVVQVAVAASDYMNFPMTTYTLAYNEAIAAVRALFAEWGGTGSGTGTIGYRGHDGTTETTFVAASASYDPDSLTTASATYPLWKAAMWPSINGWTQTELDNAATRVGFSTDATPDMGISACYLEVAVKTLPPVRTLTVGEADEFYVDLYVHPYTSATVSYVITNDDATRDVTFDYSISGTPQTPVVVGPSANSTLQLNADVFGNISDITLTPAEA